MLKLLSWNILQGGGSRTSDVIKFLLAQQPHVIVLSEFRNNEHGALIRSRLLAAKFLFQAVSCTEPDTNSVLIASKLPCNFRLFLDSKLEFSHSVIAADFAAFHLYGVYLPHKKKHELFPLLRKETELYRPAIIAGDFNTGKNYVDQQGDSFWYTDELTKLEKSGMSDAFRYIHGDERAYSWFSHEGNGYRYDHTWTSQELLPMLQSCDYAHGPRLDRISDHAPMILVLG
jgi:exodeoxyribonuclease III